MANYSQPQLDTVFNALADSTRRDILLRLKNGPSGLSGLSQEYQMSLPAIAKHVKVLEHAGLAVTSKSGRVRTVTATPENLRAAADWIQRYTNFWGEALGRFAEFVTAQQSESHE